jgi:dTDP-4-amino-4,6-dideoxygalactose transaminase
VTQQQDRTAPSGDETKHSAHPTIPVMVPRLPQAAALLPYLEEIDANRWYSNFGPLQRRLEARLAGHYALPKEAVICVGSATAGLMLALAAVAGERGGACMMPSYSFVASAHAVLAAGLVPYFVDVDAGAWAITPSGAAEGVRKAGRPIAAVLVVAPFGAPIDVGAWDEFAADSGIPVVIDAAAGFDTATAGKAPVVVSLHATKLLAAGEGGFVISRDIAVVKSIAARSNFGYLGARRANAVGFNGKLSEYGAAVGLASLDAWPKKRAAVWQVTQLYREALARVGKLRLSPGFGDGWVSSTCNIVFDRPVADAAVGALAEDGIDSRQWWSKGCHREPAFAAFPREDMSVTDDFGRRVLGLPFHEAVGAPEIARIAAAAAAVR